MNSFKILGPLIAWLLISLFGSKLHAEQLSPEVLKMLVSAKAQIGATLYYDPNYQSLKYPNGDVDESRGVCSDVIIRALRGCGVDLQELVHLDMKKNFSLYPKIWGLKGPDSNIDHRRVPNLAVFFTRMGKKVSDTSAKSKYLPGDFVTWRLPSGVPHIGIVSDNLNSSGSEFNIIHNIGAGTVEENSLRQFEITGHYRYFN